MANGAPHCLHAKPIHDSDRCSVAISLAHPATSGMSKRSTILSMLDEVIRRRRFHRWRHAERLTPRATLHYTKYTATVAP
jgi:hypothetical protein